MQRKKKYKISVYLEKLPGRVGDFETALSKYGVSRTTFRRDTAICVGDVTSIPIERLEVYAGLFSCTIADLLNYKVKVKPYGNHGLV